MKIPNTEEYIFEIKESIKTQNRRIKKHLNIEEEDRQKNVVEVIDIINIFENLKKYAVNDILSALNNIQNNNRYAFSFDEGMIDGVERRFFKIIIRNIINDKTNFIVCSHDTRDIFIDTKVVDSDDSSTIDTNVYPIERFTKGKYRKILFEYLLEIIDSDTLPKLKRKKESVEVVVKKIIKKTTKSENLKKIIALNSEIEKMKKGYERNERMLIDAKAKQELFKQKREEKNMSKNGNGEQ